MTVNWTESALADLEAIERHIARHSPRYGRSLVERIFAKTEQLVAFPQLGAEVPEYADGSLRELIESSY
ncbi:MAG TPA: type II toxin-antitoxin system RelE/ParE family toxin, partial [Gemmataceae bacterium]|nr:type II toxin-antitoxin system RelE/ParE family toxin [Gemmataceae bacterium]